jgi:hypothetical protein
MTFERQTNAVIRTPSEPENVFIIRSYFPSPPILHRSGAEDVIAPLMVDQHELDELLELFRMNQYDFDEEYEEEYDEEYNEDPYSHLSEEEYAEYLFDRRMTL